MELNGNRYCLVTNILQIYFCVRSIWGWVNDRIFISWRTVSLNIKYNKMTVFKENKLFWKIKPGCPACTHVCCFHPVLQFSNSTAPPSVHSFEQELHRYCIISLRGDGSRGMRNSSSPVLRSVSYVLPHLALGGDKGMRWIYKETVYLKNTFCHHLHTLMLFQTVWISILLWNAKKYILKKVGSHWLPEHKKYIFWRRL